MSSSFPFITMDEFRRQYPEEVERIRMKNKNPSFQEEEPPTKNQCATPVSILVEAEKARRLGVYRSTETEDVVDKVSVFKCVASIDKFRAEETYRTKKGAKQLAAYEILKAIVNAGRFIEFGIFGNTKEEALEYLEEIKKKAVGETPATPATATAAAPAAVPANYRGLLNDLCSDNKLFMPVYEYEELGPPNARTFVATCIVQDFETKASASTKKEATRNAAKEMLEIVEKKLDSLRLAAATAEGGEGEEDEGDENGEDAQFNTPAADVRDIMADPEPMETLKKILADESRFAKGTTFDPKVLDPPSRLGKRQCLLRVKWSKAGATDKEPQMHVFPGEGVDEDAARIDTGGRKLPLGRSFNPLSWDEFFDSRTQIRHNDDEFNVYLKGTSGPVFFCLHGGGYSGVTFACLAKELSNKVECRIIAPDLRGHGDTKCADEGDLSTERQVEDVAMILSSLFPSSSTDEAPAIIVVGHSMGGALAVHVAKRLTDNQDEVHAEIAGLVVIDVVEGTAMEALGGMKQYLLSRPGHFGSQEEAIKWCLTSGTVRNSVAARVSFPTQLRQRDDGQYHWRINLMRTEPHWAGWFRGLSSLFLSCSAPKLLILAGTDRLDKELLIGQMQGKFQNTVLPRVGHAVHEDSPDRLAEELARFVLRYRLATAKDHSEYI